MTLDQEITSLFEQGAAAPKDAARAAFLRLRDELAAGCPLASGRILQVPQTVVASVAGLSRQTVNRVLRGVQALGLIRVERAMICLLDLPGIDRLCRGERLPYALRPCVSCQFMKPDAPFDCSPAKRKRLPLPA